MKTISIFVLALLGVALSNAAVLVEPPSGTVSRQINYTKTRILNYFENHKITGSTNIKIQLQYDKSLEHEAFAIENRGKIVTIYGGDDSGIMYGAMEMLEMLNVSGSMSGIANTKVKPALPFRGIKFNLPFMSYRSDASLSQHATTCRDLKFWEKYLDMMAEQRYNVLSLWSLHLFHYMVKPKSFPEATQFTNIEMAEWKKFWTTLFQMAKERGIDTYVINWNTFVSPSFAAAHHVAPYCAEPSHFGVGDTSKIIEDYTKEIVKQVIDEYPDLTGLGITLGERMGGQSADERRDWLSRSVIAGMNEANRKIKFVYRAPLSADKGSGGSTSEENDLHTRQQIESLNIDGPAWLEFKYNWSHGHSSPNLFIVHGGKLTDKYINPKPEKYKYVWTVRNEDFFVQRWGQSDFIREFLSNNTTQPWVGGCFLGSEVFIPALDYTTLPGSHKTWDYSFERLWLWYGMWGQLMYNPKTPDSRFAEWLGNRYGKKVGNDLLGAWNAASRVPLMFASFHKGTNDLSLYTEGFCSYTEHGDIKLFDINRIINGEVLDTVRYLSIPQFVNMGRNIPKGMITPIKLADSLDMINDRTQQYIAQVRKKTKVPPTLDCELTDLDAWCAYARYFSDKLRAGVALTLYRRDHAPADKVRALKYIESAAKQWADYCTIRKKYNVAEFPFYTKMPFSLDYLNQQVLNDIDIVRNEK